MIYLTFFFLLALVAILCGILLENMQYQRRLRRQIKEARTAYRLIRKLYWG